MAITKNGKAMKPITARGWIAVTKSGAPSRRRFVVVNGKKTDTPMVSLELQWTPPFGLFAKRVSVVIRELE